MSDSLIDAEYTALFRELTRLARAVGAGADAEDVAQETLLHARGKLGQLRDPTLLRPWLRRSTVRRAASHRQRHSGPIAAREEYLVPADTAIGIDVGAAIANLPTRECLAITLVFGLGYSQDEAAEAMGVTRGTIASSIFRARRKLALALIDHWEGRG